jgi:hypothetical protein
MNKRLGAFPFTDGGGGSFVFYAADATQAKRVANRWAKARGLTLTLATDAATTTDERSAADPPARP